MANTPLVILASARKKSDTRKCIELLFKEKQIEVIDLLDFKIYPYNYESTYPADDDFLRIVERLLDHQQIVWATPVYWYAMSGLLKTFFDRLTDLVTEYKPIGRSLKDKETFLVAVGAEDVLPDGFTSPFKNTAHYFGMEWQANYYCSTKDLNNDLVLASKAFQSHFK